MSTQKQAEQAKTPNTASSKEANANQEKGNAVQFSKPKNLTRVGLNDPRIKDIVSFMKVLQHNISENEVEVDNLIQKRNIEKIESAVAKRDPFDSYVEKIWALLPEEFRTEQNS